MPELYIVGAIILTALIFDYINGFHDAANSIATVVSTRVLSPGKAVLWAAFFNFVAAFGFGTAVAKTVGAGMVDLSRRHVRGHFCRAGGRDRLGPHHVVPGPADELVARAVRRLRRRGGREGRLCRRDPVGLDEDAHLHRPCAADRDGRRPARDEVDLFFLHSDAAQRVDRWFRRLQLVSAAVFSLMHGANDAQKTMGIITGALVTGGYLQMQNGECRFLLGVMSAHTAIGLGTLSGGWRIIQTMGSKITKLRPVGGFAAETGAAVAIFTATMLGIGISTTHTITGAIVGVGATRRLSAVRWGVARQIVWAWVLTIPCGCRDRRGHVLADQLACRSAVSVGGIRLAFFRNRLTFFT